jgi:hypothetical protein
MNLTAAFPPPTRRPQYLFLFHVKKKVYVDRFLSSSSIVARFDLNV